MSRTVLSAVALVCGLLGVLSLATERGAATSPAPVVREVTLVIAVPSGIPATLRFEVLAASDADALAAAIGALALIAPAAQIVEPDSSSVEAQWAPWTWKWLPSEIPVDVAYNPTGAPPPVGPPVVVAGLHAWSKVETSSFRFRYGGVTENTATILNFGPDGENVISWAWLDCVAGCVLGITSKGVAHEVDMVLNSNPAAAEQLGVGTSVDWQTVILHELGHMAGLEHSCPVPFGPCSATEADAVMYYQYRGILRKLASDDVLGLSALYPLAPGATPTVAPPGPISTPSPFPEYPVLLEHRWNLLVLPAGVVDAFAAGLPCLVAIYRYQNDEWRSWIRGLPSSLQEIERIVAGHAYWLLANGSCAHIFP